MTYELDYTREDMGEIIQMIRVQKFRLNTEAFAKLLGVKPQLVERSEEGKGAHVELLFYKCIQSGYMDASITVKINP